MRATSDQLITALHHAAYGRFPSDDGSVRVLPSPPGRSDAVVAFTAHHIVAASVDPDEVLSRLPNDDLSAPLNAGFLMWLAERLNSPPGSLDVVLASVEPSSAELPDLVEREDLSDHPRVVRAIRYREHVRVFFDPDEKGVVILGKGLAGRLEVSIEVNPVMRGRGLGTELARQARSLAPPDEPLFAQVAPGNAASLRAFLDAGFRPLGAEVLFVRN